MTKHSPLLDMRRLARRGAKLTELISGAERAEWLTERREIIRGLHDGYGMTFRGIGNEIGITGGRVEQEYKKGKR